MFITLRPWRPKRRATTPAVMDVPNRTVVRFLPRVCFAVLEGWWVGQAGGRVEWCGLGLWVRVDVGSRPGGVVPKGWYPGSSGRIGAGAGCEGALGGPQGETTGATRGATSSGGGGAGALGGGPHGDTTGCSWGTAECGGGCTFMHLNDRLYLACVQCLSPRMRCLKTS